MNPRLPKDKEEMNAGQSQVPENAGVMPKKMMVYRPSGMLGAYRLLSKKLAVKNRKSKIQVLSEAVNVMNDGRKQRRQPATDVPFMEQPAMQKVDRHLLETEIKYVARVIDILKDLASYAPPSDSNDYPNFVTEYNNFAGGINKHLQAMRKSAAKLEGVDDLQKKMMGLKQQAIVRVEGLMVEVKSDVVDDLQAFHQHVLIAGKKIDEAYREDRDAAVDELKALLDDSGIDINAQDKTSGNTLLHLAAEHGMIDLVEVLIDHKDINLDILNFEDKKAIRIATDKSNEVRELNNHQRADVLVPKSSYAKIKELLNPVYRRDAVKFQKENEKKSEYHEKKDPWSILLKKQVGNVKSVTANFGAFGVKEVLFVSINKNYHHRDTEDQDKSSSTKIVERDLRKLLNPLNAISTALTFLNMGTRALIDNIYRKSTGLSGMTKKSPLVPTIIKAIVAAPLTIAEAVVSGISDVINIGVNAAVDAVKDRRSAVLEEKPAKPEKKPMKIASSTHLANSLLSVEAIVGHQKREVYAPQKTATSLSQEASEPINLNKIQVVKEAAGVTTDAQENSEEKNSERRPGR